jgi:hypothetical protein
LHAVTAKYNDQKTTNHELREQLHEAADELHKMQADRNFNQDDGFFEAEWSQLRYNIMNCMEQNFARPPKSGWIERTMIAPKDQFKRMTADYDAFLKSDSIRPLLMQALVWNILCTQVFAISDQTSPNAWAGNAGVSFRSLAGDLREGEEAISLQSDRALILSTAHLSLELPVVSEYHRWRVATASMLHEHPGLAGKKKKFIKHVARNLVETMRPWLTHDDTEFEDYLEQILEQAMALDAEMQKQRAHYYAFTWCLTGMDKRSGLIVPLHVDFGKWKTRMESLNEGVSPKEHSRPLSLVVCPALMKAGNADGEQYTDCGAIVKATVFEYMDNIAQWSTSRASRIIIDKFQSLWKSSVGDDESVYEGPKSIRQSGTRSLKPSPSTASRKGKSRQREST